MGADPVQGPFKFADIGRDTTGQEFKYVVINVQIGYLFQFGLQDAKT